MKKYKKNELLVLSNSSERAEKFINFIMSHGKKSIARWIFDDTMKEIKANWHINPYIIFETAVENASPNIMIKSKRIWWAVYQIPLEVPNRKKFFFSSKWILDAARWKKWKPMHKRLAEEILAAYSNQWSAVKKKEDVHRMAEANKAFAYLAKYVK